MGWLELSGWLFLDNLTLGVASTPLLLFASSQSEPLHVALAGSAASAAGSAAQLVLLRRLLGAERAWMRRLAPGRAALDAALRRYPSTSFAAIAIARATPLPDAPLKLVAAAVRYPVLRYTLAVLAGSLPYYLALAWIGHRLRLPAWILAALALVLALAFVADRLYRGRQRDRGRA